MTSYLTGMKSSSNFLNVFLLSNLVTSTSFMSISLLVLELWQFSFLKDWSEIWKSQVSWSEFCQILEGWDNLGIRNLAWTSLTKCYWMLQNSRITALTVSELLRESHQREVKLPPTQIRVKISFSIFNQVLLFIFRKHSIGFFIFLLQKDFCFLQPYSHFLFLL